MKNIAKKLTCLLGLVALAAGCASGPDFNTYSRATFSAFFL
ncbi:exported hypothetical protein [Verrucomicrobia bacterium]|nr:exported hypothetical protein [Verrucomicrobiota bacterium]